MTELAPPIYVRLDGPPRMHWLARLLALAIALAALGLLLTATSLRPDPHGAGTHTQLGLQPCNFLERTGIPCAGCGMTTSFSHFVRGHWITSFVTQPFGFVLALASAGVFWGAGYCAITGKASYRLLRIVPAHYHLMFWIPTAVAGWVWKTVFIVMGW